MICFSMSNVRFGFKLLKDQFDQPLQNEFSIAWANSSSTSRITNTILKKTTAISEMEISWVSNQNAM